MTEVLERAATGRWTSWRAPVRVVLWVLLVASALFALWGTPRPASQDAFAAALKAGDVVSVSLDGSQPFGLELGASGIRHESGPNLVLWESTNGQVHRTDLSALSRGTPGSDGDAVDVGATIAATSRAAGHDRALFQSSLGPAQYATIPLVVLSLAALIWLVAGPQPRRVTKWGMFWLLGLPLGVGLAWWLARDAPFVERLHRAPAPAPRARGPMPYGVGRLGGGATFGIAIAVNIGLGMLIAVVLGLGGTTNGQSDPTVPWTLVAAATQPTP